MSSQPTPMQVAARRNGSLGGIARAKKLSAAKRSEIARKAGTACSDAYGSDLYRHLGTLRKVVGRNRTPVNA